MGKASAVFLDRDGTLCEELGYLDHPHRLHIFPWAYAAVQQINQAGMKSIVITNQSGVARGYFEETQIKAIHEKMCAEMAAHGARLDAIYYCPHHPEGTVPLYRQDCRCRKPGPDMALRAAEAFDLDLSTSYVIGDRYGDIQLAHNIGARAILLLTGYGREEYALNRHTWKAPPDHIAENLLTAVEWILSRPDNMV